ncbi:hypothetical protein BH09PAT1_BH09PAT1_0500 [soil metagenome]
MKKIIKILLVTFVLITGVFLFILSHQIGGLRAFIVTSGSMEPTIHTGSLILTRSIHPSQLNNGDIITFIAPIKEREFITHRIQSIEQLPSLTRLKTKGDHNIASDSWTLAGGAVVGAVIASIPYLGYFFSFSQSKVGILVLILLPTFYILYSELGVIFSLLKNKNELRNETIKTSAILSILIVTALISLKSSHALFSDKITLTNNQFALAFVQPTGTPAPTPTNNPQPTNCTLNISDNKVGSGNIASCVTSNVTMVNQITITNGTNSTSVETNTGANSDSTTAKTTTINNTVNSADNKVVLSH